MNPRVDLLGARIPEQKRKKEKRLGYLEKKRIDRRSSQNVSKRNGFTKR
jgi:hypothetical protein